MKEQFTVYLERDLMQALTIALFIRYWLMATPSLPEQMQTAARAKGAERYEGFVQALGRRLAKRPGFIREVSLEIGSPGLSKSEVGRKLDASIKRLCSV
jgi:hypothetical protein